MQLPSLAQIKVFYVGQAEKVLFHTLRKLISVIFFMLGQYTTSRAFSYRYMIVRLFFYFGSFLIPSCVFISNFEVVTQLSGLALSLAAPSI